MAEETRNTTNEITGRSANKAKSLRQETHKPADPGNLTPEAIFLNEEFPEEPEPMDIPLTSDLEMPEETTDPEAAFEPDEPAAEEEKAVKKPVKKPHPQKSPARKSTAGRSGNAKRSTSGKTNQGSFVDKFKKKLDVASGKNTPQTGSSYKKKQAQQAARNDLLKKGIIGLIGLIIIILVIILIVNNSQVKNVGEITIDSTSTTQTLIWSGARKGLTYEVYRAEGNNGQYMLIDTLTEGENQKAYDNLTPGTLYKYNIITVKGNGTKTEGTAAQAYTVPSAVTGLSAATTTDTEGSLTVQWNLLGSTSDYELKYDLYDNLRDATTVSFSADQAAPGAAEGTYSYTINNLVPDETYYLSMRTVCGDKSSEWSEVASGTVSTPGAAATVDADPDKPMVALTFDGGPDGGDVTTRILKVLEDNAGKATFFQTGVNAEAYPDQMKQIADAGHEIGNHTYDETKVGADITEEDITLANSAIAQACGITPKLFRAPQNDVSDNIREICEAEDMAIIQFNFDSHDWEYYDPQEIIDRIETYVEDGDIIQFRNVYDETASAIEVLVPYLVEEGYQLVTVSELLQAKTGEGPATGKVYYSASEHE